MRRNAEAGGALMIVLIVLGVIVLIGVAGFFLVNASFDVVAERRAANNRAHIFVYALVTRDKGAPVHLTWRVREKDGQFKILDISAEGISMALTLRQEYNSVIRRSGGVAGLVDLMRRKLRAGAKAEGQ